MHQPVLTKHHTAFSWQLRMPNFETLQVIKGPGMTGNCSAPTRFSRSLRQAAYLVLSASRSRRVTMCSDDAIIHSHRPLPRKHGQHGRASLTWAHQGSVISAGVHKRYWITSKKVWSHSRSCSQVNYINENGEITYIHDYGDGPRTGCQYADVLIPMMWLVKEHLPFQQKVVKDLRDGYALDHVISPFSHWVLQTKDGIPNIFRVLLHI
jgi:hypothetical protein